MSLDFKGAGSNLLSAAGNGLEMFIIVDNWVLNPIDFFRGFLWISIDRNVYNFMGNFLGGIVAPGVFMSNLDFHNGMTGLEYVKSVAILEDTLDFTWGELSLSGLLGGGNSNFLDGPNADTIRLSVSYNLDLGRFFILPDNLRWEAEVRQDIQVRAWVGDGRSVNWNLLGD